MRLLALCALLTACGGTKDTPPPAPTPAPTQAKLTVSHNGAKVTMTSAVAVRWGADELHILVANNPIPCEQALGGARMNTPRDDVSFYVSLLKHQDGAWSIISYTFDDVSERGELAPVTLVDQGNTLSATFSYRDVSGTIDALVCGDHPPE